MSQIEAAFFGVLGRDAESKTSKAGKNYLRLAVRVGDGDDSQWVSVLSFDTEALSVADKLVKGSRVYVECHGLKIDTWTAQDGTQKHGLSAMSFHTRLPQIGANKPKRSSDAALASANQQYGMGNLGKPSQQAQRANDFYDDPISF